MPSFYDLMCYAKTGISSPDMTAYDKMRAIAAGGEKYPVTTITGVPPISFKSDGRPLDNVSIIGNRQQTGTPSPDNIIMPDFCGNMVGTDWTIPITCGGQTVTADLSQVRTVRRIKKLVLTGADGEGWTTISGSGKLFFMLFISNGAHEYLAPLSNVYVGANVGASDRPDYSIRQAGPTAPRTITILDPRFETVPQFKSYLAEQYADGTPVTVWYAMFEPETGIVNEPLARISTYADTLDSTDAGVMIPTVRGSNMLSVGTDLQPSEMTITGHIKPL